MHQCSLLTEYLYRTPMSHPNCIWSSSPFREGCGRECSTHLVTLLSTRHVWCNRLCYRSVSSGRSMTGILLRSHGVVSHIDRGGCHDKHWKKYRISLSDAELNRIQSCYWLTQKIYLSGAHRLPYLLSERFGWLMN